MRRFDILGITLAAGCGMVERIRMRGIPYDTTKKDIIEVIYHPVSPKNTFYCFHYY